MTFQHGPRRLNLYETEMRCRYDVACQVGEYSEKDRTLHLWVMMCRVSIFLTSWNDNSECQVLSDCRQVEPIGKVQRWVREKRHVQVSQSVVIKAYNEGMGGVHLMDRLLESYRPGTRMKKCFFL